MLIGHTSEDTETAHPWVQRKQTVITLLTHRLHRRDKEAVRLDMVGVSSVKDSHVIG